MLHRSCIESPVPFLCIAMDAEAQRVSPYTQARACEQVQLHAGRIFHDLASSPQRTIRNDVTNLLHIS